MLGVLTGHLGRAAAAAAGRGGGMGRLDGTDGVPDPGVLPTKCVTCRVSQTNPS